MELLKNEQTEQSTVTLEVRVSKEEFDVCREKAFTQNVKKINVDGFRKGKVSKDIVYKMYGENVFFEEAVNLCYPATYKTALTESKITPIHQASIDVKDYNDTGITFVFVVPVAPKLKLTKYKGLKVIKGEVLEATEEQVTTELNIMAKRLSRSESISTPVKSGDSVNFDFEGFVDGVPFQGGKSDGFDLVIGSGQFIPGFEDQLIGATLNQELDINVTFPEEYHSKELAGKPAVFKCKINNIKETILPDIDDEFAKDVSDFDTLAELKSDISEKIKTRNSENLDKEFEEKLLDELLKKLKGDIPQCMFEEQIDRILQDFAYRIQMQGLNIDDYMKMNGLEMEGFRKLFTPQAEKQVKVRQALELIVKSEKIEVEDSVVEAEIEKMAEAYNVPVEQIKSSIPEDALRQDLAINKALEFVISSAVTTKE